LDQIALALANGRELFFIGGNVALVFGGVISVEQNCAAR